MKFVPALAVIMAAALWSPALSQSSVGAEPVVEIPGALSQPAGEGEARAVAGSTVVIQIAQALNSKTARPGDKFSIRLALPITTNDGVLVPAGIEGMGEVVSASRSGAFGKAGELVLAARYLEFSGQKIPLKAFKLGGSGKNRSTDIGIAAIIAPLPIAVALLAVRGGDIDIPVGALANAKLSTDITLPILPPAPEPLAPAAAPVSDQPASETHEQTS